MIGWELQGTSSFEWRIEAMRFDACDVADGSLGCITVVNVSDHAVVYRCRKSSLSLAADSIVVTKLLT